MKPMNAASDAMSKMLGLMLRYSPCLYRIAGLFTESSMLSGVVAHWFGLLKNVTDKISTVEMPQVFLM